MALILTEEDDTPVEEDEAEEKGIVPKLSNKSRAPTFGKDRADQIIDAAHTLGLTGLVIKKSFRPYAEMAVDTYQALYLSAVEERGKVTAGEAMLLSHAALQSAMARYTMALGITQHTRQPQAHGDGVDYHAARSCIAHETQQAGEGEPGGDTSEEEPRPDAQASARHVRARAC